MSQLSKLIKKWQNASKNSSYSLRRETLDDCAAELEAQLPALESEAQARRDEFQQALATRDAEISRLYAQLAALDEPAAEPEREQKR